MPEFKPAKEVYKKCVFENKLIPSAQIDFDKIKSRLGIVDEYLESGKDDLSKQRWNSAYCSFYDALHELVEAFLLFDKIKSLNHQCLFAYLCEKHPELALSWDFFEKIRTKRNGINYYGTPVSPEDWKEIGLQINLYIKTLKKAVEEKLT